MIHTTNFNSCFIIARSNTDLSVIDSVLADRNISVLSADAYPFGSNLLSETTKRIAEADFIISVLEDSDSSGLFFESGIAYGLNKPIMLLTSLPELPISLTSSATPYIRAEVTNRDAIAFAVDQLLRSPLRKIRKEPSLATALPEASQPLGDVAVELLDEFKSFSPSKNELDVIRILTTAIKASGISIFAEAKSVDIGADIALWSDDLATMFTNPFLIEVKNDIRSAAEAERIIGQLLKYLRMGNSNGMLLVYQTASDAALQRLSQTDILVLSISLVGLLSRLEKESLVGIIRDLRNRAMHHI